MTKHFCDNCEDELTANNDPRKDGYILPAEIKLPMGRGKVQIEIQLSTNDKSGGELCKYCILNAIERLDDRPRSA